MNETLGPGARPAAATTSQPYGWDAAVACTRVAVAVAVVAVVWALGGTFETDAALQEMGFDPERARLIVALIVAALAATTVSLIGGGRRLSTFTGLMAEMAWFGGTFIDETSRVLGGSDTTGQFEPLGWLLTLASLVAAGIGVSWAAAVLAREAHDAILASIATLGFTGKRQSAFGRAPRKDVSKESPRAPATGWHRAVPLSRLLAVGVIAAVTLPILGDMFNYVPDIHMQSGGASGIAISDESSGGETPAASAPAEARVSGSARPVAPASPGPDGFPGNLVPGPVKGSLVTPGSLGSDDWGPAPSGAGRTMTVRLPAPWKDGTSNTTAVDIYLPPGYDDSETRYPVFYQAPQTLRSWQGGMAFTTAMDKLITSGQLPPLIVVFMNDNGGPYVASECADSYDGKQWISSFMAHDMVDWVDANLRSIPRPEARATLGFSQGGFCAAALLARHPDVFNTSISMSGYFRAGVRSPTTPIAWRPFGDDPRQMAGFSPIDQMPALPPSFRNDLMVIMEADPKNGFYGTQARNFATALEGADVDMAILLDPKGHSWDAARPDIPAMMRIAAMRMQKLGVFDTVR